MATIRPFRGLRYTSEAGNIDEFVAPPYDVIDDAERARLAGRSPLNVVHLTLPESHEDDRSKFVRYARSAATLAKWRREGLVAAEGKPALYRYTQTFRVPRLTDEFTRTSVIALLKVEPYDKGVVLPHEQTFPKHKEDRLRILEATRAHLECIFGLYEDPDGSVLRRLADAPHEASIETRSDDGVSQRLDVVTDSRTTEEIVSMVADKRIWIADGHHRYETALAFREMQGAKPGLVPEDFMMMALDSMGDPGLVLLPTHRILKPRDFDIPALLEGLSTDFELRPVANERLMDAIEAEQVAGRRAFGLALPGGDGHVLAVKDLQALASKVSGGGSAALRSLDVSILHGYIFEQLMGLTGIDFFGYTRDPDEAVAAVSAGSPATFLMNPPTVEDMRSIAEGGEKMPQKSTYYFPKILSGLVLWSLNDF